MWVAREKNGDLYLFTEKPVRIESYGTWIWGNQDECIKIDSHLFPNFKWEDEPVEVKLTTDDNIQPTYNLGVKDAVDNVCNYLRNNIDKDLIIFNNDSWKSLDELIEGLKKEFYE